MSLADSQQRQEATDPHQSFIVQAPAGSGKTELITQRYLRLLANVSYPEEIIALTFTRKAASEMRERVLHALMKASEGFVPKSEHQALTQAYALAALKRSSENQWGLLEQPLRLKIMTIDSLCQMLSQSLPLYEEKTTYAAIADQPFALYERAVRATLEEALSHEGFHSTISLLLEHLDNRQDVLIELLTVLLSQREQWLSLIHFARNQSRNELEKGWQLIEKHELARLLDSVPLPLREELQDLSRRIAHIELEQNSARCHLKDWETFSQLNREIAASLASLLLTKDEKLRKGFDHHVGLKKGVCHDSLYYELKKRSQDLLAELSIVPDFIKALIRVKSLPFPSYSEGQWVVLQALLSLLPRVVEHLEEVFQDSNTLDFNAIAEQACLALDKVPNHADLKRYFPYELSHLLVDEFQDTSIQQFRLISKLVAHFSPTSGKTLFVVGDPMQSIYRFRQAEVGLFLKAKTEGVGAVHLKSLELCCNFRSTANILSWVNQSFKGIFPARDDIESGAISFYPSVACLKAREDSGIYAYSYVNAKAEAEALSLLIEEILIQRPKESIAILVRSRTQLKEIIPALQAKKIPFQGVDVKKLASMSHLLDTMTLTKALLMPAHRLSWLALLVSSFAGLSLADLHAIANFDKKQSIYFALERLDKIPYLSEEGRIRARFVFRVMAKALEKRQQKPLVTWVVKTLKNLHADAIFTSLQWNDLEQFFLLLERFSQQGFIDFKPFEKEFKRLYSQRVIKAQVQIMTIHKSKGLEFDSVILPSLGSKKSKMDKPLLRFLQLPTHDKELLLLSPIHAADQNNCLLYDYLGEIFGEKEDYEQQRLLYVAATRAKKNLYLLDNQEKITKGSFRELLTQHPFEVLDAKNSVQTEQEEALPTLLRLPLKYYQASEELLQGGSMMLDESFRHIPANHSSQVLAEGEETKELLPAHLGNIERKKGIVAHELLQWICTYHPQDLKALPWSLIERRFHSLGFDEHDERQAIEDLKRDIQRFFVDPRGAWLCQKHEAEKNEYELLTEVEGKVVTRIIDRCFIAQGYFWIIDFKTGSDAGLSQKAHRDQVNAYAALLSSAYQEPIRCGLYYLSKGHWVDWPYEARYPAF